MYLDTTPAVEVHDLTHDYGTADTTVPALRGLDLTVPQGSFTAVMGPSGSGKSTLLNLVAGLEKADSGSIRIAGQETAGWSESRRTVFRREHLGIVFQGFHLIPYLTAEQNVALPLRLAGRRVGRSRVREILGGLGLDGRDRHYPSELSGGQQQRVAIARALLTDPALMLADEPTGALDSVAARQVLDLLRHLVSDTGGERTVLMVTHDPVAASYADTVVFLVDGRVAGRMLNPTVDAVAARLAHLDDLDLPA